LGEKGRIVLLEAAPDSIASEEVVIDNLGEETGSREGSRH